MIRELSKGGAALASAPLRARQSQGVHRPVQPRRSRARRVDTLVGPSESHARPDSQEPGRSTSPVDPVASPTRPGRRQGPQTDEGPIAAPVTLVGVDFCHGSRMVVAFEVAEG